MQGVFKVLKFFVQSEKGILYVYMYLYMYIFLKEGMNKQKKQRNVLVRVNSAGSFYSWKLANFQESFLFNTTQIIIKMAAKTVFRKL